MLIRKNYVAKYLSAYFLEKFFKLNLEFTVCCKRDSAYL